MVNSNENAFGPFAPILIRAYKNHGPMHRFKRTCVCFFVLLDPFQIQILVEFVLLQTRMDACGRPSLSFPGLPVCGTSTSFLYQNPSAPFDRPAMADA